METACVIQPPHTTSNNERFPFEILGLIFHQYSLEPIFKELLKLETVLLVCKAWTLAALGHKTLWSRFAISLEHPESFRYWHQRVPLWVSRCSTTCLFDIEIIVNPPYRYGGFNGQEQLLLMSIIRDLTGLHGEIARRWRSLFAVGLDHFLGSFESLVSFPIPNLIDLEIHDITSPVGCFLETPILNRVRIEYSTCRYPNLESVTDLTICAELSLQFDEEAVSKAQKLVMLTVYCDSIHCSLRGYFPLLESLRLEFIRDKAFLMSFSAPHLKTLSLRYSDVESYYMVSSCQGIQFGGLEELELQYNPWPVYPDDHLGGIYLILNAATNIKELRTRGKTMIELVLKLLENLSNFRDHHFTLKYLKYTMELGQGEERLDRIAAFRSEALLEGGWVGSNEKEEVGSDVDDGVEPDDEG